MAFDIAANYIPSWDESPQTWDETYLGGQLLPGVTSYSGLTCGPKIDKQKRRKKEGQKFADDGMKPAKFTITQTIPPWLWGAWLEVLPAIYSIKPKAQRSPLPIVHPLPNSMGVDVVYVLDVKPQDPTGGGFFKVSIDVEQWFQELKDVNENTGKKPSAKDMANLASKLGKAALDAGVVTAIAPAGPLLSRLIYGKPQPAPQKKKGTRGDSGSGGTTSPGGKR